LLVVLSLMEVGCKSACSGCRSEAPIDGLYQVVGEIHESIAESPDHLPNRAEELVEQGDAEAIFEFVRDNIAVVPNDGRSMTQLTRRVRWGRRATLRSGRGTVREKVEVLADLLDRAGYNAEVVGPWRGEQLDEEMLAQILWHEVNHRFEPATTEEDVARWNRVIGGDEPAEAVDGGHADAVATLVDQIRDALPDELGDDAAYAFDPDAGLPLVRAEFADGRRVLNPLLPDADFDDDYATGDLSAAPVAEGMLPVEVSVSYATADAPREWTTAVSGEWTADELVGRRLHLNFVAGADMAQLGAQSVGDLRVFVPALIAHGAGEAGEDLADLSVVGEVFTSDGRPVDYDPDDDTARLGHYTVEIADGPEQRAADVSRIDAHVDPSSFPCVDVRMTATDEAGERVRSLPVDAFDVREADSLTSPTLLQNKGRPPRVLFILDTSASVPDEFKDESTVEFLDELTTGISEEFESAEYAVLNMGDVPGASSESVWTSSPGQLTQQADDALGLGRSKMWSALAAAPSLEPTVVVFINDGNPTDNLRPALRERIEEGPPVLVVAVGDAKLDTVEEMARLSGGEWFEARDVEQVRPPLFELLGRYNAHDYVLRYNARPDGPEQRAVTVDMPGANASVTTNYRVPPQTQRSSCGTKIARLRTKVRVGDTTVTRVLAGPMSVGTEDAPIEADEAEVLSAMLGSTIYSFEGVTPPIGVWTEEFLHTYLAQQARVRALEKGSRQEWLEALGEGPPRAPLMRYAADPPLQTKLDAGDRTYPTGLRASILRRRLDPRSGRRLTQFDILPTAGIESMIGPQALPEAEPSELVAQSVQTTLIRTAQRAVAEAANFDHDQLDDDGRPLGSSTKSLLDGAELVALAPTDERDAQELFGDLDPRALARWETLLEPYRDQWYVLAPRSGTPQAFWAVHADTGELLGVTPDGAGGGARRSLRRIEEKTKRFKVIVAITYLGGAAADCNWVCEQFNPASTYTGVLGVGHVLARSYGAATIAVSALDSVYLEAAQKQIVIEAACTAVNDLIWAGLDMHGGNAAFEHMLAMMGPPIINSLEGLMRTSEGHEGFQCPEPVRPITEE
jgi:hypothetical protein